MSQLIKITIKSLCLFCMIFFLYANSGHCFENVVKVGFTYFPPWMILEDGEYKGFDCDLLRSIFGHMGLRVEFIPGTIVNNLEKMETGELDIISSLLFRNERNEYIRYISPPYKTKSAKSFYVRRGSGIKINSYRDLVGLRVGVSQGAKYFPKFDLDDSIVKVFYATAVESFQALADGEVQAVINTEFVGTFFINKLGFKAQLEECTFKYSPKLMPVYIGISRKSPLAQKADEIGAVIRYLKKTGEVEQIAKKNSLELN
ncbi:substrate-binding periplasmic protein [Desulfovibrio gilichinskyi]|uniref:Polar amino acid transport system substrate-binding protein n=1 Tax=Desulfovibrio gilichinskyi TaxID=1519643 RepID=A0A1X7DC05_9BACT|nr:transporter substrate-binding domain-containing protein [Desulfovibrio gilichinskyi]SMF12645.1 polar amino acid transport system substrate-binding protein [Desulfovibrio gilichinskyi]